LPLFSGFNSTYLDFTLFKVLQLQFGADLYYNTKYYANSYMPATGVFYTQNTMLIGDYPYVDVFANAKLKRLRFFIKYERASNLPSDISEISKTYGYFIPSYPYNPGIVKYGLSWTFYD
jgi:hypothetical protein